MLLKERGRLSRFFFLILKPLQAMGRKTEKDPGFWEGISGDYFGSSWCDGLRTASHRISSRIKVECQGPL